MAFDGKAFGAEIVGVVKDFVSKELTPLTARLADIEKRLAELRAPKDGKDADPEMVASLVTERIQAELQELRDIVRAIPEWPVSPDIPLMIAEAVAALPAPQDGKSVTPDDIRPLVEECVTNAVKALPAPKDGNPGKDGEDGSDGKDIDIGVVSAMVDEKVASAVAKIAIPKDGHPGKDGVGLAGALIDRTGNLVVTLTDGTTRDLGPVLGKDGDPGQPGKDGKDGFNLEDFGAAVMDDGRTVLLSFDRGELSYKIELGFPVMLYRGVFAEQREYERGDTVTWGGSLWHCDAAKTSEKPGDGSKAWTLAAKRGRDGRDSPEKAEKPNVPIRVGVPAKEH